MLPASSPPFLEDAAQPWENLGAGVRRKVLVYGPQLMLVKVEFEAGSIGAEHQHPHQQISYVERGVFEYTIAGQVRTLRPGDSCLVPGNTRHGVRCREAGTLLDAFTPLREDFLA
ncbi:cupin domain-containing protein [Hymenobacter persicinus]|uniref:Cupin domain-containing protein n=1 Tax=Hymenobacter persicinus TaxID=2025506 RepID=A0A4Q5L7R5_9BACT|nr:cupin domain-containing protein [Hymenobacter persicinus]RYU77234.1 cupin domain-containing protein [Hymenobacter persicinus]